MILIIFSSKKLISLTIFCLILMWSRIIFNNFKEIKIKLSSRRKKKKKSKNWKTRRFSKEIKEKLKRLKTRKFNTLIMMLSNESNINAAKFVKIEKKTLNKKKRFWFLFFKRSFLDESRFFLLWLRINFVKFSENSYQRISFTQQRNQRQNISLFFDQKRNTRHNAFFRKRKNWTCISFFRLNKMITKADYFDCPDYTCFSSSSNARRCDRFVQNIEIIFNTN